jgi:OPA family glycerol-3-phosphate transporter-like MFS transporter 1/2
MKTGVIDGKPKHKADTLLGSLDTTYLLSYAIFMFPSGMIADRVDLRYFLAGGMVGSGIITILFGMGKYWGIHSLAFYLFVQVIYF